MRRHLLISAVLLAAGAAASAQNVSVRGGIANFVYEPRYFPDLWGDKVPRIPCGTVKIGFEDQREDPYAVACRQPEFGVAFSYDPLGTVPAVNGPGCGSIYGVYGYLDRPLIRTRRFSLEYSFGVGAGFVFENLYDPVDNPWNVVISLPVNARICMGGQMKYQVDSRHFIGLGLYLNHCSNGLVYLDNYGYNAIELGLIVGRNASSVRPYDKSFGRHGYEDGFRRRFEFDAYASGGITAVEAIFDRTQENVQRFKYAFHADAIYRYCRTHATGLGTDVFVTPYFYMIEDVKGMPSGTLDPVSVGISIVHEATYHDLSFAGSFGKYLYHNDGIYNRCAFYQMTSIKYTPKGLYGFFFGAVLKAHSFTAAESIQLVAGKKF